MDSSNEKDLEKNEETPAGNAEATVTEQATEPNGAQGEDATAPEAPEASTEAAQEEGAEETAEANTDAAEANAAEQEIEEDEAETLRAELAQAKDKHLRLYSEFENFRRRTAKEKLELKKTATESLMNALLPILDDFERAAKSLAGDEQKEPLQEGLSIIQNKFKNILEQKGLKSMEAGVGEDFDAELHEAITQIPAPEEGLKGKIVDVIEQGYYLGEKVIRFAKVVIGA